MTDKSALPFAMRRAAVKAHKSRGMQIKALRAMQYLQANGLKPKVACYGFFSKMPSSYRAATGHDYSSVAEQKIERLAQWAHKVFLS